MRVMLLYTWRVFLTQQTRFLAPNPAADECSTRPNECDLRCAYYVSLYDIWKSYFSIFNYKPN